MCRDPCPCGEDTIAGCASRPLKHCGDAHPLYDAITEACRTGAADLGHIARAIGMTPSDAFWAMESAVEHGFIKPKHYGLYERA